MLHIRIQWRWTLYITLIQKYKYPPSPNKSLWHLNRDEHESMFLLNQMRKQRKACVNYSNTQTVTREMLIRFIKTCNDIYFQIYSFWSIFSIKAYKKSSRSNFNELVYEKTITDLHEIMKQITSYCGGIWEVRISLLWAGKRIINSTGIHDQYTWRRRYTSTPLYVYPMRSIPYSH